MDQYLYDLIKRGIQEDLGSGDITSEATIRPESISQAAVLAKQDLVLAGSDSARAAFQYCDPDVKFTALARDGDRISAGTAIAQLSGNTRALLAAERVALNLLQHLSGIATLTAKYVDAIKGLPVVLKDTRKTMPGLRSLEKYAVRMGGGSNHRFGLFDGILIKDNHIKASGGIAQAVRSARTAAHQLLKIEVETGTLAEVQEALDAGADIIMLDNMPPDQMRRAVAIIGRRALVEASGNVNLGNIRAIAETGVDFISSGSITHSAPAADISMKIT